MDSENVRRNEVGISSGVNKSRIPPKEGGILIPTIDLAALRWLNLVGMENVRRNEVGISSGVNKSRIPPKEGGILIPIPLGRAGLNLVGMEDVRRNEGRRKGQLATLNGVEARTEVHPNEHLSTSLEITMVVFLRALFHRFQ